MFESKQNKRNSKKKSFFSSDKKAGLNIGGGGYPLESRLMKLLLLKELFKEPEKIKTYMDM